MGIDPFVIGHAKLTESKVQGTIYRYIDFKYRKGSGEFLDERIFGNRRNTVIRITHLLQLAIPLHRTLIPLHQFHENSPSSDNLLRKTS